MRKWVTSMPDENARLDQAGCTYLVARFLHGQNWQLVEAAALANAIWTTLAADPPPQDEAETVVQTQVWQRYGAVLHDACATRQAHDERAWRELRAWLSTHVGRVASNFQEQEDVLQDALLALQQHLQNNRLRSPHAFFAYALQVMKRTAIDRQRRRRAGKRGHDLTLSLDGMHNTRYGDEVRGWQETVAAPPYEQRKTERTVTQAETRQQLIAFFHEHLASELQRQVATAHFLDNLSPAEIAALLGKKPHEIRMVKARAVQALRSLPPEERNQLLAILDAQEQEKRDE